MGIMESVETPQLNANQYGQMYGTAQNASAQIGGQQQQLSGMLGTMAAGGGPNPALAAEQQGINQGQMMAQAQAGSARGQFGLANAQHNAMTTGAGLASQGAAQGSVLVQQQQMNAMQLQMQNLVQQRAAQLQAQGMDANMAMAQAQASLTAGQFNAGADNQFTNNLVAAAGSAGSGIMSMAGKAA